MAFCAMATVLVAAAAAIAMAINTNPSKLNN